MFRRVAPACLALFGLFGLSAPVASAGPEVEFCTAVNRGQELEALAAPLSLDGIRSCRRAGLQILRNTIFARHGYAFSTPALKAHFSKFKWYKPDPAATRVMKAGGGLSAVEQANVELIKAREASLDRATSYTHRLKGKRLQNAYASSEDVYHLCPDGRARVQYTISEMVDHHQTGRYRVIGSRIIFVWFEERGKKGVGEPKHCASTCQYERYEPFAKEINTEQVVDFADILGTDEEDMWKIDGPAEGC